MLIERGVVACLQGLLLLLIKPKVLTYAIRDRNKRSNRPPLLKSTLKPPRDRPSEATIWNNAIRQPALWWRKFAESGLANKPGTFELSESN